MTLASFMRATFEALLPRYSEVCVAFVRHLGLVVPESALPAEGEAQVFSYGLNMPVPVTDLAVTDVGISATLSFSHTPHPTFVPWEAVVTIQGRGELAGPAADPPRSRLSLVP